MQNCYSTHCTNYISREFSNTIMAVFTDLWLEWINDERELASSSEEKKAILELFERAVQDYLCEYSSYV